MYVKEVETTYTIVLATRLKRRVFQSRRIPVEVVSMAEEVIAGEGAGLLGNEFCDYGISLFVKCESMEKAREIANRIRRATSGPIRAKYPELWKMPSLWNRNPLVFEGDMTPENRTRVTEYYESLKSR